MKTLEQRLQELILGELVLQENTMEAQRQSVYLELESYKAALECSEAVRTAITNNQMST